MSVRITPIMMMAMIAGVLTLLPISGFAGSAQDAFKKLQAQSGSGHKSSSSGHVSEKKEVDKDKAKKSIKDLVHTGSKRLTK